MTKKFLITIFLIAGLFFGFLKAEANNLRNNCQGGVCASTSDDLSEGSTGIDPNKTVNLSFSVYKKDTDQPPVCSYPNTKLYYAIKHFIGGSPNNWEYVKAGAGQDAEYSFNSGQAGQKNLYSTVFYCWSFLGTAKVSVDEQLKKIRVYNWVWDTPEFNVSINARLPVENKTETKTAGKKTSLNFPNPLQSENLNDLIATIMHWLRIIVLPIAVIVIVISGIMMMYSRGDPGKFATGKKMLIWAVVGLAVILIGEGFTKLISSIIELKNR